MFPLINKRETGINIRRIMDKQGITARDIQKYLGLGCVQSVYRWLDGISMPTIDNLYALSELFGLSIDDMVCGNRKRKSVAFGTREALNNRIMAYYTKINERTAA